MSDILIVGPTHENEPHAWKAAAQDENGYQFFVFNEEFDLPEAVIFEGLYSEIKRFFEEQLPRMRRLLLQHIEGKQLVKLYMGAEIGTLYAAYYCHVNGIRYALNLVDPKYIGGKTPWAQQHPLLLNKLITTIFSGAIEVQICGKEHYEMLPKAFPRIQREWRLSYLTPADDEGVDGLSLPSKDPITG